MIRPRGFSISLALLLAINAVHAATKTWDGGAGTTNWADASNWNANGAPTSSDAIWLITAVPQITALDGGVCGRFLVDGPCAPTLLTHASTSQAVIGLYGATVNSANTGSLVYLGPSATASVTFENVIFRLHTSGEWKIETGKTLRFSNGHVTESGQRSLTKTGGGTLLLDGPCSFTGQTEITAGTLALGPSGNLAQTAWIALYPGATFDVSALPGGFTFTNGRILAGKGTVNGSLKSEAGARVGTGMGIGTLTITNGFQLAAGATMPVEINGPASYDQVIVTAGDVALAGALTGSTVGYAPAVGDAFYLIRNDGPGVTSGTLSGAGDGDILDLDGRRFLVSFTSDFGGSGFAIGGSGNDVALRKIEDPPMVSVLGSANTASVQLQLVWQDLTENETAYEIYRLNDDGTRVLLATLPAGSTSFTETVPNYTSYTYAVQALGQDGMPLGGLKISNSYQAGSSFESRREEMLDYLSQEVPNLSQTGSGPNRIGRTGFWCGQARLLRGDTTTGLNYITTALEDCDPIDNPGFSMWPGMDTYYRWGHLFPQSLKDRYRAIYTFSPRYNTGATPNQRFMLCVAAYLAYGLWGDAMFLNSGAYYGTSDPTGKAAILNVLNTNPWKNFEEHNSNHYLQYSLAAMESLALYAPDAEVRNKARMVVNWGLAEAAGYWHNGHWCVSSTRGGAATRQYAYDITPWTWRLLFGGPAPDNMNFFGCHATMPFAAPEFPGMLPELETASRDRSSSYTRRSFAQRSAGPQLGYFKQSWMTPKYALWSQAEGTVSGYNADGSIILSNMNTVAIQDGYQGQRWALAWDSPPAGDSVLTITTPTSYGSSTGTGISIYEDTLQHQDTMIAVYNIPASGGNGSNNGATPCQWLNGHIPAGYHAITDEASTTGRIFLHYDSMLVAIYLTNPFTWSTNFTTPCTKAGLAIETAAVTEFPQATAAERLAAFRVAVLANAPEAGSINTSFPRLVYTNRHGHVLDLTYGYAGKINGVSVDYQSWPMLEDPWMYQSQRGHLHVFGKDRTIVSNYYNWTTAINQRPTLSTTVPVAASLPVDIDLVTRVADSETPGHQLHFSVSAPVNGNVDLLADGRTARFSPAAGYGGPGSFVFTARDRGIHSGLVWSYDFEPPADLSVGRIPDASGTNRSSAVKVIGSGSAALVSGTPAALGATSTQAIRLTGDGSGGVCLSTTVTRSTLEMSNGSWTFGTWFKRASDNTDDFIFYLGTGDGSGGSGDELQLHCPANSDTLRLGHTNSSSVNDVLLTSAPAVTPGQWHHAAITFEKTTNYTGILRIYLNGVLAGDATVTSWYLAQDQPLVLGGHASNTSNLSRYFDGWLDESTLLRGALNMQEIRSLASQSVANFGGLAITGTVDLNVSNSLESWRQTHFNTAVNSGNAANTSDPDGDGFANLIEYALGTLPNSAASRIAPQLSVSGGRLMLGFTRTRGDVTCIVEGSSDLSSWVPVATDPGAVGQYSTVIDTFDHPTDHPARRFLRLRVTNP
jgi:autotransporter-associated beta strand protein